MGKIPAFEGTDGLKLIEGRAIARYSELSTFKFGIRYRVPASRGRDLV